MEGRRMNTKLIAASIAFAAIVSVGLGTGRAGQGGRAHRGPGGPFGGPPSPEQMLSRLTEDLDLTSDQAAQIKTIMTDEASKTADLRSKMHDLETQLHDATAN